MLLLSVSDLVLTYIVKAVLPTGDGQSLLKVVRLARLARLLRMLHFKMFAELKAMVLGVIAGVRVLAWAIVLLLLVLYVVGLAMNNIVGSAVEEFRTVPEAMLTVFRCYTDGCTRYTGTPLHTVLFENYGAVFFCGYILIFMVVTVGIFNLIMAIFIDNVSCSSLSRRLNEIGNSFEAIELLVRESISKFVAEATNMKYSEDVTISRQVFNEWLDRPAVTRLLETMDIEVSSKAGIFDVLDVDMSGELEFEELIGGLMHLRGPITKSDIVAVRLKVRYMCGLIEDMWTKLAVLSGSADDETILQRHDQILRGCMLPRSSNVT